MARLTYLRLSILSILTLILPNTHQERTASSKRFLRAADASLGARRLFGTWTVRSLLSCGTQCMARYNSDCRSFMYNNETNLCTPAGWPDPNEALPTGSEGQLYVSVSYNAANGFDLYTYGQAAAVLHFPNFPANYEDADAFCRLLSSHLLTIKSDDEKHIPSLVFNDDILIGLTDRAMEGNFTWDDDGTAIGSTWKDQFFYSNEPNDHGGNEDCVLFTMNTLKANDIGCGGQRYFICQRPIIIYQ